MSSGCPVSCGCLVSSPEFGKCLVFVGCPVAEYCLMSICCLVSGTQCAITIIYMSGACLMSGGFRPLYGASVIMACLADLGNSVTFWD